MSQSSATSPTDDRAPARYAERLKLPWWALLIALFGGLIFAAEIWMGVPGARGWVAFGLVVPVVAGLLWWLGRVRVAVRDGEFLVDDARLPVRFVADVVALDLEGRREVLSVGAHPLAFVVQRPWIAGAVQIVLDDPADPTPYWVVSTRHPVRLAEAILAERDASAGSAR
ncbi:DUF3093 domain-containing protein [Melissospora conviva]|uniref:DUF3093 domain-containing protein n=1 Tax=Melissospora conviva TaxID=3388432 RepID=UPI003C17D0E7